MPRRPLALRACAVTAAVAALVVVPAGWASAGPLLPGGQWATTVDLPDAWADRADQLGVTVAQLRQQEHSCTPPEVRAGDDTCGDDEGELAEQVVASVAAGRYTGGDCEPTTAAQPLDLFGATTSRLTVTGPECLLVVLDFPDGEDDDLAQSDALGFTLSLVAGGPGGGLTGGGTTGPTTSTNGGTSSGGTTSGGTGSGGSGSGGTGSGGTGSVGSGPGSATDGSRAGGVAAGQRPGGPTGGQRVDPRSDQTSSAGGAVRGGTVRGDVGSTTADVEVGAETTETGSTRTVLDVPLALGALLLGLTALFWVLFLVLRRRRREQS
ncbi:hypothetical protein [Klenkia marina]|uniref:hypothetical protein n=1 Tax=Klenkia marina TaxID=1960309 RepID=UPI001A9F0998|nr:hypothetical protein [Klenkia marina]